MRSQHTRRKLRNAKTSTDFNLVNKMMWVVWNAMMLDDTSNLGDKQIHWVELLTIGVSDQFF